MKKSYPLFSIFVILFALLICPTSPVVAQESTQPNQSALTLAQYLRGLHSQRVTFFPVTAKFIKKSGDTEPFYNKFNAIHLTVMGSADSQEIQEIQICLTAPQNTIQTQRWIKIITATLAVLAPDSSEIDRLLSIDRAVTEENYSFHQLLIQHHWQECGRIINIQLA